MYKDSEAMIKSEDDLLQSSMPSLKANQGDVRVACLLSSSLLMNGNDNDDSGDVTTAASTGGEANETNHDGPPSVIETFSPPSSTARELIAAIGDDDVSHDLSDDNESEDVDDNDDDYSSEETSEGENVASGVTSRSGEAVETTSSDNEPATENTADFGLSTARVEVKSLIKTVGDNLQNTSEATKRENGSIVPVMKGFLFVALLPVCCYILKETSSITRDVSLDLFERGILNNLFLVHLMIGLNVTFAVLMFLCVVMVLLDPSRLHRFLVALSPEPTQPSPRSLLNTMHN